MKGRFSDRPDREHGNPLKPVRTRDDVGKNLANAILAGSRQIFPTICAFKTGKCLILKELTNEVIVKPPLMPPAHSPTTNTMQPTLTSKCFKNQLAVRPHTQFSNRSDTSTADGNRPSISAANGNRPSTSADDGNRPSTSPADGNRSSISAADGNRPSTSADDGNLPPFRRSSRISDRKQRRREAENTTRHERGAKRDQRRRVAADDD